MNRLDSYHSEASFFVKEKIEPAKTIDLTLTGAASPGQNPVDMGL
jgi:hypothetical protein